MSTDHKFASGIIEHFVELRSRIMYMLIAWLLVFCVLAFFAQDIYTFVATPLIDVLPEGGSMIATNVVAPFFVPYKLAMLLSIFITMPFLLYQIWCFVAPGLYTKEKRLALPLMASSVVLFYMGVAFAYFVLFKFVFAFIVKFAPEGVQVMTDISSYLDFVVVIFLTFGCAFEVPVATVLLVMLGVASPDQLAEKRPFVIVGAFVIGMFLTPPDVVSQFILAIPIWLLFEIGIFCSRFVYAKPEEELEDL